MVGLICVHVDTVFGIYGYIKKQLSLMFEHDCLDTCCFGCLICMCLYFCICTCSAQLSMFHMEKFSRNKLIIIVIIIIIIVVIYQKETESASSFC